MKHTELEKIKMLIEYAKSIGLEVSTEAWENEDKSDLVPMYSWDEMLVRCRDKGVKVFYLHTRISVDDFAPFPLKFVTEEKMQSIKSSNAKRKA